VELRVVFKDLLGIVAAAGSELDVADDRGPVARGGGESERGDGIKRFEDVALAGNERAAECGIEIMFLNDAPGKEIHRLSVAGFYVKMLDDAVFDFVGVGEGGVAVETDEVGKVVDAGDVAIGRQRLNRVFIAVMS